jgi:hypothetical protein
VSIRVRAVNEGLLFQTGFGAGSVETRRGILSEKNK